MNFSIIILAGRFDEKVCHKTSKGLLTDSSGVSLIEHQILALRFLLPEEIIVVTTNNTDRIWKRIKNYKVRIVENQLYDITNEVEDARLGILNASTDNYLILNSNVIPVDLSSFDAVGSWLSYSDESSGRQKAGLNIIDGNIEYFSFDMPYKLNNIMYLTGKESRLFRDYCFDKKKNMLFLFEILGMMIKEKIKLKPKLQKIYTINTANDLRKLSCEF